LDHEEAVAVQRHVGADIGGVQAALHRGGLARIGRDRAGHLPSRRLLFGDEIDEVRVDPLEAGRLRIGDVARDVLERKRLRLQAGHGRLQRGEDIHAGKSCVTVAAPTRRHAGLAPDQQSTCQRQVIDLAYVRRQRTRQEWRFPRRIGSFCRALAVAAGRLRHVIARMPTLAATEGDGSLS
jgi:hypothetical protein